MFPGNTCSSSRHAELWQTLISDRFLFQEVKKVDHWTLKGVSTFFDRNLEAQGPRRVIIQSEWTDWLINHPTFHPQPEWEGRWWHTVRGACVHDSWYEMKSRWRWRYDSDDQSFFFFFFSASMWHETKWWNYLRVHLTQSISAWVAFPCIHGNLIRIVQTRGVGLLRRNLSQLLRVHCVPAMTNQLRPFRHERTPWAD